MTSDDTASFDAAWERSGLSDTLDLSPEATITDRTLAQLHDAAGADGRVTSTRRAPGRAGGTTLKSPAPHTLPPISVSYPDPEADAGGGKVQARPPVAEGDEELTLQVLLGAGGMGCVWLGRQRSLGREVAVKTLHDGAGAELAQALVEEAVVTGALEHPSIVPVHALGRDDQGRPLLVMKRVEGTSWSELLGGGARVGDATKRKPKGFPDDPADQQDWHLDVLERACHALELAHSRGVVHRDLKPDNVMVGDFGEVYLVDWGIATPTGPHTDEAPMVGTPAYMAPEMVRCETVDARTDVYLLGAVLHEVLTGLPPHAAPSLRVALSRAHDANPPEFGPDLPNLPEELTDLCRRALSRDPADRPAGADAFRQALAEHRRHRASRALMRSADAARAKLSALVAATSDGAQLDLPSVRQAITEARFGYRQALAAWPGNAHARDGLVETITLAVQAECLRKDPQAARAWLSELAELPGRSGEDPELVARVDEMEATVAREQAERDRLDRMARELDPAVGARARAVVCGVLLLFTFLMSRAILERIDAGQLPTPRDLVLFAGLIAIVLGGIVAVFRRRLLATTFNRRIWSWAFGGIGTIVLHRFISALTGESSIAAILARDLAIIAGLSALAGFWLFRWLFAAAAVLTAAAIWSALDPSLSYLLFSVAPPLMFAGFVLGWDTGRSD